jgi:hypothetical protein
VADLLIATETSTSVSQTIAFMIRDPIATGDVPALRDRVCALLADGSATARAREENAYTLGVQALLDGSAALDLRQGPVVLHVPALAQPRWHIVQIGDVLDEVVANVGGIKGPRAGAYAICGPDFRGELPGEMTAVRLRTTQGVCGFPKLSDAPAALRLFDQLGQTMRTMLPTADDVADPLVAAFHQIRLSASRGFDHEGLDDDATRGLQRAAVLWNLAMYDEDMLFIDNDLGR